MTLPTNTGHSAVDIAAVVNAYFAQQPGYVEICRGGIINKTYLLHFANGEKYILQRLHTLFSEATVTDFQTVSSHLAQCGQKTQRLIPTTDGKDYYRDSDGKLWRVLTYISGTDAPENMSRAQLTSVGKLLGELHKMLNTFTYKPVFTISGFHDTPFYAQALDDSYEQLTTPALRAMADECLQAYNTLVPPPAPLQLIHGDPRTTNVLFDPATKMASCYIDFDTLMHSSPWVDIGDLLRSISGSKDQTHEKFAADAVQAVMQGYLQARPQIAPSYGTAMRYALASMQLISIELAMRFLIDTVQDNYFGWDTTRFSSRRDNNIACAKAQLAIYRRAAEHL